MAMLMLIFVAIGGLFAAFYFYRRFYVHKLFVKEGIPGPKPNWLDGNASEFADETKRHLVVPNWTKQYGAIYGFFEGSTPTLVTSDVDMVAQIFVKQAHIFHGRKLWPLQPDPDAVDNSLSHMLFARGERWKRLRTIANPTFSAGKLRSLMPLMTKCQDDFMKLIDRKVESGGDNEAFNLFECFQLLTLDTIGEAAFGVELNSLSENNNKSNQGPLLTALKDFFHTLTIAPASVIFVILVPELSKLVELFEIARCLLFNSGVMSSVFALDRLMTKVVKERKENSALRRQDLMQMMLDMEQPAKSLSSNKGLTGKEIVAQAIMFMIAGYETSSNALGFTAFLLANHPQVQDKLLEEIDSHFANGKKAVDYESISELKYLDCVINESLRLFPVAPMIVTRMAMDDTEVNGIRIKKGTCILADVWTIHRDETEWGPVDTEAFHPERFQDDYPTKSTRRDAAFLAFGFGPRICIGVRFAMLEIKLTLVNLLLKYRIEKTPRTGDQLKLIGSFSISAADGVWVKLQKRQ